ncbi:VOC family metalloprotein YjdN [Shigella flexneri]
MYEFRELSLNWLLLTEVTIIPLSPYLSFAGNCSDAIAYYQRTLGAELLYKISFGKCQNQRRTAPSSALPECNFPYRHRSCQRAHCRKRHHDQRCHAVRKSQLLRLYAGARIRNRWKKGKRWFDNVAANGKIEMAWQEVGAHGLGKVTDKFGVPWMINVVKQQPTR